VLERVEQRATLLVAVHGNNDGDELRGRLPEVARVELGGVRFPVVHETGGAKGRERRCSREYADVDVLVFGHSHIPWDTITETGLGPGRHVAQPSDARVCGYSSHETTGRDDVNHTPHRDELPLPDYDHLAIGDLQGRIRSLDTAGIEQLLAYERAHGDRLPVVNVLAQRLRGLRDGAESSGGDPTSPPLGSGDAQTGSQVDPSTQGPPVNPRNDDQPPPQTMSR
jgi:hypothetical protein